jgi:hypothetical protein
MLVLAAALTTVTVIEPRIHVRWRAGVSAAERAVLEQRYGLASGEFTEGTTLAYELRDGSRDNIAALIREPAVEDTGEIDRPNLRAPERQIRITFPRARFLIGESPSSLLQVQSVILFAAAGGMLWAGAMADERRRRTVAVISLVSVGILAYTIPLGQPIRMGDSGTYIESRESFELFSGVRQIRYEAHLSHAILGRLDALFGRTAASPERALDTLMRAATAWFILCAVAIGIVERWTPLVVRYLALALLAPVTLLYFGYRELGHLSLNVAAFPLFVRGLHDRTRRLEAGSVLFGIGAALHGFGLLSLAGAGLATLAARMQLIERIRLALRVSAFGLAAYLGWIALYLVFLRVPIVAGHAASIPLRPWFADEVGERLNAAIFSVEGGRDLFFTFWVIGAPLLAVAASLWRYNRDAVRTALVYSVPSLLFTVMFWPIQGIGVEMDLVFAAFPALYALAWVCAHDQRRTLIAAAVLATAHLAFWRIVLSADFVNSPI